MPQIVCDNIDRLITVEMRREGMNRGVVAALYEAAREKQGDKPLTYLAATSLIEAAKQSKPIIISTSPIK